MIPAPPGPAAEGSRNRPGSSPILPVLYMVNPVTSFQCRCGVPGFAAYRRIGRAASGPGLIGPTSPTRLAYIIPIGMRVLLREQSCAPPIRAMPMARHDRWRPAVWPPPILAGPVRTVCRNDANRNRSQAGACVSTPLPVIGPSALIHPRPVPKGTGCGNGPQEHRPDDFGKGCKAVRTGAADRHPSPRPKQISSPESHYGMVRPAPRRRESYNLP